MRQNPHIVALIVAAGVGKRAGGDVPKQYASLGGKALLRHSVEALLSHPSIAAVQVVIHPAHAEHYAQAIDGIALKQNAAIDGGIPSPLRGGIGRGASNVRQHLPLAQQELTQDRAQALRKNATEAEKKLWGILCREQLAGTKFRRQVPIDHYIADFVCLERRLIIEADSGQHDGRADAKRTAYLESQGFTIVRFWNNDVLGNIEGVRAEILRYITSPPHLSSPARGEEEPSLDVGAQLLPPLFGGAERADSVAAGLRALAAHSPDYVLIHDAARPFLSQKIITRIIAKLAPDVGVVPALAVADTLRREADGVWEEVPRDNLLRIQTPQAFPFAALTSIVEGGLAPFAPSGATLPLCGSASPTHDNFKAVAPTDDAATWLAAGRKLVYVEGDEHLRKVTTGADMAWAQSECLTGTVRRIAVAMGFDVHELMPSGERQTMRIGGIDIPSAHKTHGHSDADVVLHAIVDALLGTIAAGDIGEHFSPKDDRWKGADSRQFATHAHGLVKAEGGVIQHVDVTVIGESPKIAPHRDAMRAAIAQLLEITLAQVSVKATTTEKLGFTGRGEGIAAQAVATVSLPGVV